jgi:hypothetical protein
MSALAPRGLTARPRPAFHRRLESRVHLDLSTTAVSVAGATPSRSYQMLTTDPTTVVDIVAADNAGASGASNGVVIKELTFQSPRAQVTDSSTYVYYVVKQGTPPNEIWMDAADAIVPGLTVWSVVSATSDPFQANPGELVIVSTDPMTVQLPSALGISGQQVAIKDNGAGNTITVSSSQSVDGTPGGFIFTEAFGYFVLVSDGSNWWII